MTLLHVDINCCGVQECLLLWCTGLGINPANKVVEFNELRYRLGLSWPPSYRAIIYTVDPGLVLYANELVIVKDNSPAFYVCDNSGHFQLLKDIVEKIFRNSDIDTINMQNALSANFDQKLHLLGIAWPSISFQKYRGTM